MVGLQGDREREERVKNKGKTSNRFMTTVLRALVLSVLSVAVMVSVYPGLRSCWNFKEREWGARRGMLSNAGGCVCKVAEPEFRCESNTNPGAYK